MLTGANHVRIHGQDIPVWAEIAALSTLSAHTDANETLQWLSGFRNAPKTTFITHGEPAAADALRQRIERSLRWTVRIPEHLQEFDLGE
jgi:metallo-beta-lactamase family protein